MVRTTGCSTGRAAVSASRVMPAATETTVVVGASVGAMSCAVVTMSLGFVPSTTISAPSTAVRLASGSLWVAATSIPNSRLRAAADSVEWVVAFNRSRGTSVANKPARIAELRCPRPIKLMRTTVLLQIDDYLEIDYCCRHCGPDIYGRKPGLLPAFLRGGPDISGRASKLPYTPPRHSRFRRGNAGTR